jgi:hypothetical protein
MGNFLAWLISDPVSACQSVTSATKNCAAVSTQNGVQYVEVFHFYVPWMIFCALGLLIPFYYAVEGRRRFIKGRVLPLYKYMADRIMTQLAWLSLVGWIIIGARAANAQIFSMRFWRYAWAAWAVGLVIYWIVYLVRKHPRERKAYLDHQVLSQYVPESRARRKNAAKASSR